MAKQTDTTEGEEIKLSVSRIGRAVTKKTEKFRVLGCRARMGTQSVQPPEN